MCGRYLIPEDPDERLREIISEINRREPAGTVRTAGEVFPTDVAPVIANSRALRPRAFAMRWGYAREGGRPLINARGETALDKPTFRDGMLNRRCLVPAGGYFEWARALPGKPKYLIRPHGAGHVWMAGLYRPEADRAAFVILTRAPAEPIAFIHDRMPVLLGDADAEAWLDPAEDPVEVLSRARLDVSFSQTGDVQLGMALG